MHSKCSISRDFYDYIISSSSHSIWTLQMLAVVILLKPIHGRTYPAKYLYSIGNTKETLNFYFPAAVVHSEGIQQRFPTFLYTALSYDGNAQPLS